MKYIRITMMFLFVVSLGLYGLSWVKEKQLEDSTKPSLTSDREEMELSVDYEEGDLLEGLTASDAKDGDLTDQIIVGSFSQFLEPGVCNVSYVVFDSVNQPAVLTEDPLYRLPFPAVYAVAAVGVPSRDRQQCSLPGGSERCAGWRFDLSGTTGGE